MSKPSCFYAKCPLRPNSQPNSILARFYAIVKTIKEQAECETIKSSGVTKVSKYQLNGLTLKVEKYYEETTTTILGIGCVYKALEPSASYFDINAARLSSAEKASGLRGKNAQNPKHMQAHSNNTATRKSASA